MLWVAESSPMKQTAAVPRPVKGVTSIIWLIFTITLPGRDYDPYWTDKENEVHIGWRVRGGEYELEDRRRDPNAPVPAQRERAQVGKLRKAHKRVSQPKTAGANQPLENKIWKTSTQASPTESIIPVTHPQIGDVPWSPNGGIHRCPTKSSWTFCRFITRQKYCVLVATSCRTYLWLSLHKHLI